MIAPKPALQLGAFALLSAAFLAGLHALTRDTIAANQAAFTAQLLAQVSPAGLESPQADTLLLNGREQALWRLNDAQGVAAIVLPVTATGGYSGDIELLVGIDRDFRISGVRVTAHRETPGLGDEIDTRRGDWIRGFDGHSLNAPLEERWAVKKDGGDFDQFTGATITPRAVVRAVRDTLLLSREQHALLFSAQETKQP